MPDQPQAPQNIEAEEALLGSCELDPQAFRQVQSIVGAADFFLQKHAWIWEAIAALDERGTACDFVLLADELQGRGHLDQVGGAAYLTHLINAVPSALHVREYALKVAGLAERRRTIQAGSELVKAAHSNNGDFQSERARIAAQLLREGTVRAKTAAASDAMGRFLDRVEYNHRNPLEAGEVRYLSTGLLDLDRMLGGMCPGLYLIGAVTHTGKTAFCLNIALNVAEKLARGTAKAEGKVLYFSPEMTADQLVERAVCARARVDSDDLDRGTMDADKWPEMVEWQGRIADWPLLISQARSLDDMRAEIYRHAPLALVVVDGIELVTGTAKEKTHEERGEVVRWGLEMANDGDVLAPVLMPMQIATKVVKDRGDKRPKPGDFYSSSEPEMAADVVLTLHREDRWTIDKVATPDTNELEVFLWKHRLKKKAIPSKVTLRYGDFGDVTNSTKPLNISV